MDELKQYIDETGVQLYEVKNIKCGKKLYFKMGQENAEINLFSGKRGFLVVQSPKTSTSADLNKFMAQLVNCFIWSHC
jgi:hypothetical protein